jgi:peptide/nickel transport system ATP-binding protein
MSLSQTNIIQDPDVGGANQPLLIIDQLYKRFPMKGLLFSKEKKYVHALNGVSFELKKGETLGVVGESGCGKSTLAKLISGLLKNDSGELIFDGQGVNEMRGISLKNLRKNLQMVFQDSYSSLNPRLTIEEAIAFGPTMHGMNQEDARELAIQLLGRVGLDAQHFGNRYPSELSGGQRQRVNIARALAFNPKMLILDESVAALDKSVQAQILNLLIELKKESQLTFLFISHDLQVVNYISDRLIVMYLGQIVEYGPSQKIFEQPRHPYTKALFSSVPEYKKKNGGEKIVLSGDPPNPIDLPSGCKFKARCAHAKDICAVEPKLIPVEPYQDYWVACHLAHAQKTLD